MVQKQLLKQNIPHNFVISSFLKCSQSCKTNLKSPEVVILCSGNNGLFSYEDSVCAGNLIAELIKINIKIELNDASKTCSSFI